MSKNSKYFMLAFVIFCTLYFLRLQSQLKTEYIPNKNYIVKARVTSIKEIWDNMWRVKIGPFWVDLDKKPQFGLGDRIQAIGRIERRVTGNFYPEFWLISREIEPLPKSQPEPLIFDSVSWPILRHIALFRSRLEQIGLRLLPQPQSALLLGIVLGSQQRLSPGFYEALRLSGTLHIVVASGMNVTILGKVILSAMVKRFRRWLAVLISLLCILIYTFLAGGEPPIVRAALMGGVAFTAQVFGRQYWAGWALFLAAALMLLISPEQLFQIGFQLSVVATAGLLFVSPWLTGRIEAVVSQLRLGIPLLSKALNLIKTDLVETTSAQVAVLPLLMAYFGQFNLLAIVPNILIGFLVPIVMRWGGVLLVVGLIWEQLAQLVAWVVWVPLAYMTQIIRIFGQINWFTIRGEWAWWIVLAYWTILALGVKRKLSL
jgi:competence protein ComEC